MSIALMGCYLPVLTDYAWSASNNAFASWRSAVSKPSVNQL
jgi:hypothetical protein